MTPNNRDRWHVGKEIMCIYTITNKVSGKTYVGQTKGEARKRWSGHVSTGSGGGRSAIKMALTKHGVVAFEFSVLDIAENQDQLNHKEEFWIRRLGTLSPFGYNLEAGGRCADISDETREKMSRSATGKVFSADTRRKLAEASRGRKHTDTAKRKIADKARGRWHSESTRLKISAAKCGVRHTLEQRLRQASGQMCGKVIGCSNGLTYSSNMEAAQDTGASSTGIGNVIHGRRKSANGLRFWLAEKNHACN